MMGQSLAIRTVWIAAGVAFSIGLGFLRYSTGPEFALTAIYLLPVVGVSWAVGTAGGVIVGFASAISWLVADLSMVHVYSSAWIPVLNESFRLIVFLLVATSISLLRTTRHQKELALTAATTDPLTGVYNRRGFDDFARKEIGRLARHGRVFSAAYLDLDGFKGINDRFGHSVGDELLRIVAETLSRRTRNMDVVARMGGDEFAVLLPETGQEAAVLVTGRLRSKLLEAMRKRDWPVTFSIGVVTFLAAPESADQLLADIDKAMYSAKHGKKDTIEYRTVGETRGRTPLTPRLD